MKRAFDFRLMARGALQGKWGIAVLTGFVASLLGANVVSSGVGINFNFKNEQFENYLPQQLVQSESLVSSELLESIFLVFAIVFVIVLFWLTVILIVSGAVRLGYAKFNLNLIDQKQVEFSDLFSQFNRFGTGFCMNLLVGLYIFFWSLLFVIPGIIKLYSYSMTPYILAEHPELTANQAITKSRQIMAGNKWRLFCLQLSFIGWDLLSVAPILLLIPLITMGIPAFALGGLVVAAWIIVVQLFLTPYKEAATAAFYREISFNPAPPVYSEI